MSYQGGSKQGSANLTWFESPKKAHIVNLLFFFEVCFEVSLHSFHGFKDTKAEQ